MQVDKLILTETLIFRMMTKRSQSRKRFGRRNFKQRYFRLTTQSLSYAKSKGKRSICDIPLSEILAVERLNEKSFKLQNIFQVSGQEIARKFKILFLNSFDLTIWQKYLIFFTDCTKGSNIIRTNVQLR